MQITVGAILVKGIDHINGFLIEVNEQNFIKIKMKLEAEYTKLNDILQRLKDKEVIKSVFIPKNKQIQDKLNLVVASKKVIKTSIENMRAVFSK